MFALGTNMFLDPLEIRLALREARQKIFLRHTRVTNAKLHDLPFLSTNDRDRAAQVANEGIEHFGREL